MQLKSLEDTKKFSKNVSKIIKTGTSGLRNILGKPHIIDCDTKTTYFSDFTYKNAATLLHYIFVLILNSILRDTELNISEIEEAQRGLINMPDFGEGSKDEDILVESSVGLTEDSSISETIDNDPLEENISKAREFEQFDIDIVMDKRNKLIANLLNKILMKIKDEQGLLNKHTLKKIKSTIDKISDIEKEDNLKFMELLDKEARYSFKAMISSGIDTWKNLSTKNKDLYFDTPIAEDDTIALSAAEKEEDNRHIAKNILGENYTEEQYSNWLESRTRAEQESRLAYEDRDILSDDE